ncbi:hypothetical protein ACIA58_23450 [Kribbella sp. NPDC051586]|uniref:hypothetical protein n=1 Tax=Kribbella sp. NPDC051586 TaxID=3364118 RepID=UPI00379AD26A
MSESERHADVGRQITAALEQMAEMARAVADLLPGSTIGGDFVSGSQFKIYLGQHGYSYQAYRMTSEELHEVFVEPDGIAGVRAAVRDNTIVVLHGPAGYGKGATLLNAVKVNSKPDQQVFRLHPTTDLSRFSCAQLPKESFFVLDDLPAQQLGHLEGYAMDTLLADLSTHRCKLVISTPQAQDTLFSRPGGVVVELSPRPPLRKIFDSHLNRRWSATDSTPKQLLAQPGVQDLMDTELRTNSTAYAAARLALLVAHAAAVADPCQYIADRLQGRAAEECGRWFGEITDLRVHCLAVSLAVLNGLPREIIARQADELELLVRPPTDGPASSPATNPFAAAKSFSLAALRAEVLPFDAATQHGVVPTQALRYVDREFAGLVLHHVWREHDAIRTPFVRWLQRLGTNTNQAVRTRAATAVGVLACESFEYLAGQIMAPWARDKRLEVRLCAAAAVSPVIAKPALRDPALRLVELWSTDQSSRWLRATAAHAYGQSVSTYEPQLALESLVGLADTDDADLMIAIGSGFCDMVFGGTAAVTLEVLDAVAELSRSRDRDVRLTGGLSFLGMALSDGLPGEPSSDAQPSLVLLTERTPQLAPALGRMWSFALHDPDLNELFLDCLDDWAVDAEAHVAHRAALIRVLRQSAQDPRTLRTLRRRAEIWSGRNGKAPVVGRALLTEVSDRV